MGTVIGTCGHEIISKVEPITIESRDIENNRGISVIVVCEKCRRLYKRDVLRSQEAINKWIGIGARGQERCHQ